MKFKPKYISPKLILGTHSLVFNYNFHLSFLSYSYDHTPALDYIQINLKYISKVRFHSENHLYANQDGKLTFNMPFSSIKNSNFIFNRRKKNRKRKTNVSVKGTTQIQRAAKLQELKTLMMSLRRTRPFLVKTPKLL